MRRIFPLLFVVLLLMAVPAGAQTLGTITGEVKDASGAVIPGVTVTVINNGTNATREVQSNAAGAFSFPALPPGPYTVRARASGFPDRHPHGRASRGGNTPRGLHAGNRHIVGNSRGDRCLAAHLDRERDDRYRYRQPTHRRAAAQRAQLSVAHRVEHERHRRVRGPRSGRRSPGRYRAPNRISRSPASGESSTTTRWTVRITPTSTSIRIFCCRRLTRSKSSRCRRASTRPSSAARPAR